MLTESQKVACIIGIGFASTALITYQFWDAITWPQCLAELGQLGDFASAILALMTLWVVIAGALIALPQLREVRRGRQLQILPKLMENFNASAEDRGAVYSEFVIDPDRFSSRGTLPRRLRPVCERVINSLSEIGLILNKKLIETEFMRHYLHIVPARLWLILHRYVESEEAWREQHDYAIGFGYVAHVSFEFWDEAVRRDILERTTKVHASWDEAVHATISLDEKCESDQSKEVRQALKEKLEELGWLIRRADLPIFVWQEAIRQEMEWHGYKWVMRHQECTRGKGESR